MKELGKARRFALDGDEELLIEALAPVEGGNEYRSIAFLHSRIDYLFAFDEKLSGMVLTNGVTIPVALPFADLKQRIYGNDFSTGSSIDLTLVTGKPVSDEKELRLSKKFNPAADAPVAAAVAPADDLDIVLFAHAEQSDRQFKLVRFKESQIGYFEPHGARKDKETFVSLKPGVSAGGFTKFYVATPMHHFTYYVTKARQSGDATLDLTEATRPKDSTSFKME